MPVLAHDEVVVHGNAERARDLDDRLRHLDVGARRGGIAGGVVVHEPMRLPIMLISLHFSFRTRGLGAAIGSG
jgi:hypothetical protein